MIMRDIGATLALAGFLAACAFIVWIVVRLIFLPDKHRDPDDRGRGGHEDYTEPPPYIPTASERLEQPAPMRADSAGRVMRDLGTLRGIGEAARRADHDPIPVEIPPLRVDGQPVRVDVSEWPWEVYVER